MALKSCPGANAPTCTRYSAVPFSALPCSLPKCPAPARRHYRRHRKLRFGTVFSLPVTGSVPAPAQSHGTEPSGPPAGRSNSPSPVQRPGCCRVRDRQQTIVTTVIRFIPFLPFAQPCQPPSPRLPSSGVNSEPGPTSRAHHTQHCPADVTVTKCQHALFPLPDQTRLPPRGGE